MKNGKFNWGHEYSVSPQPIWRKTYTIKVRFYQRRLTLGVGFLSI